MFTSIFSCDDCTMLPEMGTVVAAVLMFFAVSMALVTVAVAASINSADAVSLCLPNHHLLLRHKQTG